MKLRWNRSPVRLALPLACGVALAGVAFTPGCLRPPEEGAEAPGGATESGPGGDSSTGSIAFLQSTWGDASGKDGQGGTKLTISDDGRLPIVSSDFDKSKRGDASTQEKPGWLLFHGTGDRSLTFDWVWVTKTDDKFFAKTWAGGGVAFNDSWAAVNGNGARYLVLWVKATKPEADLSVKLYSTLKSKGREETGEITLSQFVPGGRIGTSWQRAVIPLSEFPEIDQVELSGLQQVIFNVKVGQPENERVAVYVDNMYLSSLDMVTPVTNLGYLVKNDGGKSDGVELFWNKDPQEKVKEFAISVEGRKVLSVPGSARSAEIALESLGTQSPVTISVACVGDNETSDPLLLKVTPQLPTPLEAQVTLEAPSHQISKHLFGINWGSGSTLKDIGATGHRWGGNRTTKYNWKDDLDSAGVDWFYLNDYGKPPGTPEKDKSYFKFIKDTLDAGAIVNFALPISPWIAKKHPTQGERYCSFPTSVYPNQERSDGQGCGNGKTADGKPIWDNDPNLGMTKNSPELQKEFVETVVKQFGAATNGGVEFYSMDNEPGLWMHTHRDTMPKGVSAEELAEMNVQYAQVVKTVDPSAKVIGFGAWGVKELAGSNLDFYKEGVPDAHKLNEDWSFQEVKKHGGDSQLVYLLKRFKQAEATHKQRLIDVIDIHWYQEIYAKDSRGENQRTLNDLPYDKTFTPVQFEALREWWDPTFVPSGEITSWTYNPNPDEDKLWRQYHPVIPAFKKIIETHYPGTRLAINEYDNGSPEHYHGALLRAAALGIFMQEDLYMAQNWHQTGKDKFTYWAQKLYGNYDDKGSRVQGRFVRAKSGHADLYSYGATDGKRWQVILVNKNPDHAIITTLQLRATGKRARSFTLAESLNLRLREESLPVTGKSLKVSVPAFAAVLVEVE